jgi:hypothetical protein
MAERILKALREKGHSHNMPKSELTQLQLQLLPRTQQLSNFEIM